MEEISGHKVELEMFEGPMDLLLYLIKKEDVNIYDIPIFKILEKYTEFLKLAEELNIDLAGEFLLMASELTFIKSQMLLPPEPGSEEDEGPDPREDLVKRLLEYQQYKEAASSLSQRPQLGRDIFAHAPEPVEILDDEPVVEIDTITLLSAFHDLLKRLPGDQVHKVNADSASVSEKMVYLVDKLKKIAEISFYALFEGERIRSEIVVTFLALLEMTRLRMVRIFQNGPGSPIMIKSQVKEADEKSDHRPLTTDNRPFKEAENES